MPFRTRARLLLSLCLALGARNARSELIERILAVVDQRPLLLSEVEVLERVKGLERKEALEKAIDERLMYAEAARAPQSAVSPEEEQEAYSSLLSRASPALAGLAEARLRAFARREAVILKYVAFRFLPQIRIGDDAVKKAYLEEVVGRKDVPSLAEVEADVRQRLVAKDLDARIEAWIKELRSAAQIRYTDAP